MSTERKSWAEKWGGEDQQYLPLSTLAYAAQKFEQGQNNLRGKKMFDFRRITLFCLGYRISRHKMSISSKNWGVMAPCSSGYTYACPLINECKTKNWYIALQVYLKHPKNGRFFRRISLLLQNFSENLWQDF